MNTKDKIMKKVAKINPLAKARRNRMRSRLTNPDVSFLCPNCMGGILFHDLGLRFLSPTVNLMMTQSDFVKFITDSEKYLNGELDFFNHETIACPCAKIYDITVHFTHYKTPEQAREKWNERKSRINWDNAFVFLMERDGITKEDILSLKNLKVKGLLVFTAHEYPDIPYTLCLKKYIKDGEVGNVLKKSYLDDSREYEKYFDFVGWFNEADGTSFDISPWVLKK